MPSPKSTDLRRRVVAARKNGNATIEELAILFGVSTSSVKRYIRLAAEQGSVEPAAMGGARRPRLVTAEGETFIRQRLAESPGLLLRELAAEYTSRFGVRVSARRMGDAVARMGFTRKRAKKRPPASQRKDVVEDRQAWLDRLPTLDITKLIFMDEAGFNRSLTGNYGWAPRGETPIIVTPSKGKNATVIGAIDQDGIVGLGVMEGYMNTGDLLWYLKEALLPELDGEGYTIVWDNLSAHKNAEVRALLGEHGVNVLFLPAYSPELNPIELVWAEMKRLARQMPILTKLQDVMDRGVQLWEELTGAFCRACVRHCGFQVAT